MNSKTQFEIVMLGSRLGQLVRQRVPCVNHSQRVLDHLKNVGLSAHKSFQLECSVC